MSRMKPTFLNQNQMQTHDLFFSCRPTSRQVTHHWRFPPHGVLHFSESNWKRAKLALHTLEHCGIAFKVIDVCYLRHTTPLIHPQKHHPHVHIDLLLPLLSSGRGETEITNLMKFKLKNGLLQGIYKDTRGNSWNCPTRDSWFPTSVRQQRAKNNWHGRTLPIGFSRR